MQITLEDASESLFEDGRREGIHHGVDWTVGVAEKVGKHVDVTVDASTEAFHHGQDMIWGPAHHKRPQNKRYCPQRFPRPVLRLGLLPPLLLTLPLDPFTQRFHQTSRFRGLDTLTVLLVHAPTATPTPPPSSARRGNRPTNRDRLNGLQLQSSYCPRRRRGRSNDSMWWWCSSYLLVTATAGRRVSPTAVNATRIRNLLLVCGVWRGSLGPAAGFERSGLACGLG